MAAPETRSNWHIADNPASNTAVSVAKAAVAGKTHVIQGLVISVSGTVTAGTRVFLNRGGGAVAISFADDAGPTAQVIEFGDGLEATGENAAITVTSDVPGAGGSVLVYAYGYTTG